MSNPITLTASLDINYDATPGDQVVNVYFGDVRIASLPPAVASKADHGDDSSYFDAEERRIVEETVAPILERLFGTAIAELADEAKTATIWVERAHGYATDDTYGPFPTWDAARAFMQRRSLGQTWVPVHRAAQPVEA